VSHPLLARLRDRDPGVRRAACREAPEDASAVLLVDALVEALADPDKGVARAASDALARIGQRDAGVSRTLAAALQRLAPQGRLFAALAIARLEPPPLKLLPPLVSALALADGDLRWTAVRLLVELGRSAPEVLPLLLALVAGDEQPEVRRMAVFALRELAPDRDESARALLAASRAGDVELRRAALVSLAALWEPGRDVVARLCGALAEDPDAESRGLAASALGELAAAHPERVAPAARAALESALRSGPAPARAAAERALRRIRPGLRAG
jgi:HEAT repeat protein